MLASSKGEDEARKIRLVRVSTELYQKSGLLVVQRARYQHKCLNIAQSQRICVAMEAERILGGISAFISTLLSSVGYGVGKIEGACERGVDLSKNLSTNRSSIEQ